MSDLPPLVHGVRADAFHWIDAWNFSLAGTRHSANMAGIGAASPREIEIEQLRTGDPHSGEEMVLSPFMIAVLQGRMIRSGIQTGFGVPPHETTWFSREQEDTIVRRAERELLLEAVRRQTAPEAASRLVGIWTAEDTLEGRNWIRRIVGSKAFLIPVRIRTSKRLSRRDSRWLDRCEGSGARDAASGYWSGEAMGTDPLWEHLIEGVIEAADQEELERLRAFIREQGPPTDLLGPPTR